MTLVRGCNGVFGWGFKKAETAALASLAVWVFMSRLIAILSQGIAAAIVPDPTTAEQLAHRTDVENIVSRISPTTLYSESVSILLDPRARIFGLALQSQAEGILPTPLALSQSMNLIWPHITTLFALVAVCFGISYIIFMRAEIRA